jgi:hypothetical protein
MLFAVRASPGQQLTRLTSHVSSRHEATCRTRFSCGARGRFTPAMNRVGATRLGNSRGYLTLGDGIHGTVRDAEAGGLHSMSDCPNITGVETDPTGVPAASTVARSV